MQSMHTADYKIMRARLRRRRKELKITLAAAGKVIGISDIQMSRAEKGQRRLDAIEVRALARFYGQRLTDFVDD